MAKRQSCPSLSSFAEQAVWIDFRHASSCEVAREQCDGDQADRDAAECRCIEWGHADEQALERLPGHVDSRNAGQQANDDEPCALTDDKADHAVMCRPERQPY